MAPTARSTSASASFLAELGLFRFRTPANWGWPVGKLTSVKAAAYTLAPSRSATCTASPTAPDWATRSPTTITGFDAPPRMSAAFETASTSGRMRWYPTDEGTMSTSAASSRESHGKLMNTGPVGGVAASLKALRTATGISEACLISTLHLVY